MIVVFRPVLPAGDVVGLEDRDVRDAVAGREVVGRREAVAAAADDHDVVGGLRLVRPADRRAGSRCSRSSQAVQRGRRRRPPCVDDPAPAPSGSQAAWPGTPGDGPLGDRRRSVGERPLGVARDDVAVDGRRATKPVSCSTIASRVVEADAASADDEGLVGREPEERGRRRERGDERVDRAPARRRRAGRRSGSGAGTVALRVVERRRRHDRLAAVDRRRGRDAAVAAASRASAPCRAAGSASSPSRCR